MSSAKVSRAQYPPAPLARSFYWSKVPLPGARGAVGPRVGRSAQWRLERHGVGRRQMIISYLGKLYAGPPPYGEREALLESATTAGLTIARKRFCSSDSGAVQDMLLESAWMFSLTPTDTQ